MSKTPKGFFDSSGHSKSKLGTNQTQQSCIQESKYIQPTGKRHQANMNFNNSLPLDPKFGNENRGQNFYDSYDFSLGAIGKDYGHELSSNWVTPNINKNFLSQVSGNSAPDFSYQNINKTTNANYSQGNLDSKLNQKSFLDERDLRQSVSYNSITNQIKHPAQPHVKAAKRYVSSVIRKRLLICIALATFLESLFIMVTYGLSNYGWYNLVTTLLFRSVLVFVNWYYFKDPSSSCLDSLQFFQKSFNLLKANDFHFLLLVVYCSQKVIGNCYLAP